jgi:hypothetical protein
MLPDLRVLPSSALQLHEEYDSERVERLMRQLDDDGVIRNPPVVAPLTLQAGRPSEYVVLDGANRVTAMQRKVLPHAVVQVVSYDDPAVALDVWAHLLPRGGQLVRALPVWMASEDAALRAGLSDGTFACGLVTPHGVWGARVEGDLAERVRALAAIVGTYKGQTPIYRTNEPDLESVPQDLRGAEALVLFPWLSKSDIQAIARLPVKLPSGISRHVVSLRALRINVDLAMLRRDEPVAVKQARLDALIRTRLLDRRVRHYPEATVVYDE